MESSSIESSTPHAPMWLRFLQNRGRHPQSSLLIGAAHNELGGFAHQMARALLCKAETIPCDQCQSCKLALAQQNPDIVMVHSEKAGAMIKIDQIRDLQQTIFTTAQLGENKAVIINPADRMNVAAANALLKLLEEPPAHVYFILLAEQLSTVMPTIISRCQQWRFCDGELYILDSLQHYAAQSPRGEMIGRQEAILYDLQQLQNHGVTACSIAAKWSKYPFEELIWFYYLIIAEIISQRLGKKHRSQQSDLIQHLALHANPLRLFAQLDNLHRLIKCINQGTSINQLLALEDLLHGFM